MTKERKLRRIAVHLRYDGWTFAAIAEFLNVSWRMARELSKPEKTFTPTLVKRSKKKPDAPPPCKLGRMKDLVDSTGRVNVRIHPVSKARMIAECERRSRQKGTRYSLAMLINDLGWSLPPLAASIELQLSMRAGLPDNGKRTAASGRPDACLPGAALLEIKRG